MRVSNEYDREGQLLRLLGCTNKVLRKYLTVTNIREATGEDLESITKENCNTNIFKNTVATVEGINGVTGSKEIAYRRIDLATQYRILNLTIPEELDTKYTVVQWLLPKMGLSDRYVKVNYKDDHFKILPDTADGKHGDYFYIGELRIDFTKDSTKPPEVPPEKKDGIPRLVFDKYYLQ